MLEQLIKCLHKPKSDFKQLFVLWEISPDTTEYIVDASNDMSQDRSWYKLL